MSIIIIIGNAKLFIRIIYDTWKLGIAYKFDVVPMIKNMFHIFTISVLCTTTFISNKFAISYNMKSEFSFLIKIKKKVQLFKYQYLFTYVLPIVIIQILFQTLNIITFLV